jgi:hypothetical protein
MGGAVREPCGHFENESRVRFSVKVMNKSRTIPQHLLHGGVRLPSIAFVDGARGGGVIGQIVLEAADGTDSDQNQQSDSPP